MQSTLRVISCTKRLGNPHSSPLKCSHRRKCGETQEVAHCLGGFRNHSASRWNASSCGRMASRAWHPPAEENWAPGDQLGLCRTDVGCVRMTHMYPARPTDPRGHGVGPCRQDAAPGHPAEAAEEEQAQYACNYDRAPVLDRRRAVFAQPGSQEPSRYLHQHMEACACQRHSDEERKGSIRSGIIRRDRVADIDHPERRHQEGKQEYGSAQMHRAEVPQCGRRTPNVALPGSRTTIGSHAYTSSPAGVREHGSW